MPTAGKLCAAALFAALAYLTAELFKPAMPEGTAFGPFSWICAGIGAACGWLVMGPRVRLDLAGVIAAGLQTALVMALAALAGFATEIMIGRAFRKLYDGPAEAIIGIFEVMVNHGRLMLTPDVLAALLIGGPLCGVLAGMAGKRWS